MKKIISLVSLGLLVFSCTTVNILNPENQMYRSEMPENITASGTHFDGQITDESWGNRTEKNYSVAQFKNYNSGSFVKLQISKPVKIEIHQLVKLNAGNLKFQLKQKNAVLKEKYFQSDAEEFFQMELESPGTYELYWTGENANGSYFIEWKELD